MLSDLLEKLMNVGKSTLCRWLNSHHIVKQVKSRKNNSLFEKTKSSLSSFINQNPFSTSYDIIQHLKKTVNITPSQSTVCRTLKRMKYVRKHPTQTYTQNPEIDKLRYEFSQKIRFVDPEHIISIDETNFYINLKPQKGYVRKGHTIRKEKFKGGRRLTVLLAVTSSGIKDWTLIEGSCNAILFSNFVNNLKIDKEQFLLLDNVKFHHSKIVLNTIKKSGLTDLYLPPYTPQWQPIEYVFSSVKNYYRSTSTLDTEFEDRIQASICMSDKSFNKIFNHCWLLACNNKLFNESLSFANHCV